MDGVVSAPRFPYDGGKTYYDYATKTMRGDGIVMEAIRQAENEIIAAMMRELGVKFETQRDEIDFRVRCIREPLTRLWANGSAS